MTILEEVQQDAIAINRLRANAVESRSIVIDRRISVAPMMDCQQSHIGSTS